MENTKRFLLPVLYLLLASMATSIFFGVLAFLNSLGITIFYYRASLLEAVFLSRQLDLYALWLSTLVVFLVLTGLAVTYGWTGFVEWLSIYALAVGIALLPIGSIALATILILAGQVFALITKSIYHAGSYCSFSRKRIQALMVVYLLSLVLLIELPALIYWVVAGFWPSNVLDRRIALLETNLAYAASSMAPWLYVAFLFGWLWAPAVLFLRKEIANKNRVSIVKSDTSATASPKVDAGKPWSLLLPVLIILGLSVFVGYYPYWHEPEWLVGTDVYWRYKGPLDGMASMTGLAGFGQALKEHQSGFLVLLFGLMKITGFSSQAVLRCTPMVLTVMTAMTTFWLARTFGFGTEGALLSATAGVMWIPTTIGIFTSILANWFALIVWIVFLAILVKKDSMVHVIGAAILGALFSLAILFIHPWSWGPFAAATSLCLVTQILGRRFSRSQLALYATFCCIGLVTGYVSLSVLQTSEGLRIANALSLYIAGLVDPKAIFAFPDAIGYFATMWSPFLSPLLVVVTIVGVLAAAQCGGPSRLILSWLCVTSIGSILATALGYSSGGSLWRVFFIAPMAILTALGALYVCRTLERKLDEDGQVTLSSTRWHWVTGVIFSTLGTSVISVIMSVVLPELGLFLGLVMNLLLMTLLFHSAYDGVGTSRVMGVTMAVLIVNSGLRSLAPLLVDPHNISLV